MLLMSRGGMAVQYIKKNKKKISDQFKINVQVDYIDMPMVSMPVTQLADIEIDRKPNSYSVRKLCLQFGTLTEQQESQLKNFIETHTTGLNDDRRINGDRRKYIDPEYNDPAYEAKIDRRAGEDRRRQQ